MYYIEIYSIERAKSKCLNVTMARKPLHYVTIFSSLDTFIAHIFICFIRRENKKQSLKVRLNLFHWLSCRSRSNIGYFETLVKTIVFRVSQ